jgi:hypothetical protein
MRKRERQEREGRERERERERGENMREREWGEKHVETQKWKKSEFIHKREKDDKKGEGERGEMLRERGTERESKNERNRYKQRGERDARWSTNWEKIKKIWNIQSKN